VGGKYKVRWASSPIIEEGENGDNYVVVAQDEVPGNATSLTATFTIPEAHYGINYVQLIRDRRPDTIYGFTFNVESNISVTPSSGSPGSKLTIEGTGFPDDSEDVSISLDGKATNLNTNTNDAGSFTAQFTIPDTIAGKHEFKATVENVSIGDVSASFQVKPKIIMEPEQPEIGSEVILTGSGFAANSQVSIEYDDITITNSPPDKKLTTDENGSFSHTFNVPESSETDHIITATDKSGNVATFGLPLEGEPPAAPNLLYPCNGQRFGWFGPQTVTFKWEPVSDPSGVSYTFEVGTNTQVWPPTVTKTGLTSTTCAITLEPGTYFWRVKAIDGAGNESDATLAPYPFKVGFFSIWLVVGGILIFAVVFILIVRAFFRRMREYYK